MAPAARHTDHTNVHINTYHISQHEQIERDFIVICWVQRGDFCVKPDKLREMEREEREKRQEGEERSMTCCFHSIVT